MNETGNINENSIQQSSIGEISIEDVKPYQKNAKKHPEKQIKLIAESIKRFGFDSPIIIDKNNEIIAGHGRLEAAKLLGLKEIPFIRKENLTDEEVKAYRLADNKIAESEWDMSLAIDELKGLGDEMFDLTGFDRDLLIEDDGKDDLLPENPPAVSKIGDLYELGEHRVLAGDATKKEDVASLMGGVLADLVITDPPYNTGMEGKPNDEKARLSHMFNDKIENWEQFLKDIFTNFYNFTKGQCAFYVFIDWRRVGEIKSELEKLMDVKNVIVWDKQVHGLGSDYKSTYEHCVVGKKGKPEIHNRYGLDYQDIWRLQREMGRNKAHATAKPIELLEKPIKHASKEDDIVLDLFGGSGSTLIACEKTSRVGYLMELDEKYIDTIVQRYVDYTGNENIFKNGEPIIWKQTEKTK